MRHIVCVLSLAALVVSTAPAFAAPTPAPTPSPTPPPHAPSCSDGTTGPGTASGSFPVAGSSTVSSNVAIQIYPDSPDARTYIAETIALVKHEAAASKAPGGAPTPVPTGTGSGLPSPASVSALIERLQPVTRGTSVDGSGAWACFGLAPATYRLLATLTVTSTVKSTVTPPPLPSTIPAGIARTIMSFGGTQTIVSRYYYTATLGASSQSPTKAWNISIPFGAWTSVASVVEKTR